MFPFDDVIMEFELTKTTHTSPSRETYWVPAQSILEKTLTVLERDHNVQCSDNHMHVERVMQAIL